jgi:hypothetical protein
MVLEHFRRSAIYCLPANGAGDETDLSGLGSWIYLRVGTLESGLVGAKATTASFLQHATRNLLFYLRRSKQSD